MRQADDIPLAIIIVITQTPIHPMLRQRNDDGYDRH